MTDRPKRLLALDGGGLMGLISLGYLTEMERQLRDLRGAGPEFRLRDVFDYISGTSTGAIIAAALALGRSAEEIRTFYLRDGPSMFARASLLKIVRSGFAFKYDRQNLARILQREFSSRTILQLQDDGDLATHKHLMIVLRNSQTDSTWPMSSNPEATYNRRDHPRCNRAIPLWQIVRASTAAPSFFRPEQVKMSDGSSHFFVDGGLTPHNNPAWKMFQMATEPRYNCRWDIGHDKMLIVSVGTGHARIPDPKPNPLGASLLNLARRTPGDLMRGTAAEIDLTCRIVGHCLYGHDVDREVGDLTGGDPATKRFSYVRYNTDLSLDAQVALGVQRPLFPLEMDDVSMINHFDLLGRLSGKAEVHVADQFGAFASA